MADIRKQLGVDWLKGEEQRSSERAPPRGPAGTLGSRATDDAVLAYGRRLIEYISTQPGGQASLYDAIDALNMQIESALPVVRELQSGDYLEIVSEDPRGNHTLRVTQRGKSLLR